MSPVALAEHLVRRAEATRNLDRLEFLQRPEEWDVPSKHPVVEERTDPPDEQGIKKLSTAFPQNSHGGFAPSEFQRTVLEALRNTREKVEHHEGLLVMATAVGKTVVCILDMQLQTIKGYMHEAGKKEPLWPEWVERVQMGDSPAVVPFRMVFHVHTKAIKDNAYRKFKTHFSRWFPDEAFFNHKPSKPLPRNMDKVLFAFTLFQSRKTLDAFCSSATHAVYDEAHHLLAPSFRAAHRQLSSVESLRYSLGMTATLMHRSDPKGDKLRTLFRNTLYMDFDWRAAKRLGYFPPVEYLECLPLLEEGRDIPSYATLLAQYREHCSLSKFLSALQRSVSQVGLDDAGVRKLLTPKFVVDKLQEYQRIRLECGLAPRRRILVFASGVRDAQEMANLLTSQKVAAACVSYKSTQIVRTLRKFSDGKLNVLISCNMINEGFDVREVDCCLFARVTESEIVFAQQLGRALRKSSVPAEDPSVAILDCALNLRRRWVRLRKELPDKQVASSVAAFFDVSNFVGSWVGGNEGSEEERGEDVNVEVGGGGGHRGVAGVLVPPTSLDGLGMDMDVADDAQVHLDEEEVAGAVMGAEEQYEGSSLEL